MSMSTERSTSWSQMTEHAQTLLAIRASLFDQFERDGCFSDALVQTIPATQRAGLLAPLAFGAEGVVIPLGLFSYIARTLDEKKGYLALKEKMTADSTLKRFAVERVKTTEERSRFEKLFEKAFPLLSEFSVERASNQLAPYAAQDVLDLDCWILAALVDLDDLFFMGPEFIAKIKDKQQQQHERAIEVVSDALGKLQGLLNLNYPSDANRRGWVGNLDIMKALNDLPITASEQRVLPEKISGLPAAGAKREEWLGFIGKVLSHRNVVETTLVTTRAVLTFTVVAESAYREQETTSSAGVTERLKEAIGFFDSSGNDIFRAPAFGSFVLQEFIRLTALAVLPSEDYDAFIHTIGILSFAVTRGYFADGEDPERFRDDVQKLVPDRRTLVDMMLTAIEGGFEGVLVKQGSFVEKPNWLLATKNWQLMVDAEGTPLGR